MKAAPPTALPRKSVITSTLTIVLLMLGALLTGCSSPASGEGASSPGSSPSGLQVGGTSQGGAFLDGQTITVSMPPNRIFKPHLRVNILQCTDPGGKVAHLPTNLIDCDENTIQSDSLIPQSNGSFSETAYTIYRLPSPTLGEGKSSQPVCNQTSQCVLYVGQDQNDFKKPKVFSHPFTVTGGGS